MGRIKRGYYTKAFYHIYNRGNNRVAVLQGEDEKALFLRTLADYKERFQFKIYGIVLMDNHFHMLLETNQANHISKVMQAVLLSFGNKYRKMNSYCGHLWQHRFQSRLLENEGYVLECLEYIHENPVKAGLCQRPQDYLWSSCFLYTGLENNRIAELVSVDRFGTTSATTLRN
jgi:REP element-mobilizing transposase RayT